VTRLPSPLRDAATRRPRGHGHPCRQAGEQAFAVAEHDLTGPLRELVMTVLAEGDTT